MSPLLAQSGHCHRAERCSGHDADPPQSPPKRKSDVEDGTSGLGRAKLRTQDYREGGVNGRHRVAVQDEAKGVASIGAAAGTCRCSVESKAAFVPAAGKNLDDKALLD